MKAYTFNISLSILNHLGRNLYRSFITVLGEAISNSWDADAKEVQITIDRDANLLIIKDDGDGMSEDDFQNKFLKIGYSKRKGNISKTALGRPFIGRKGIGKLALLSCAKKITVLTKTENTDIIGGELTQNQINEISNNMLANSIVKSGGKFEFTYISKEFNNGNVSIWPTESDDCISGIFNQSNSFDDDLKIPTTEFKIMLPSNNSFQEIELNLYEQSEENKYILSQDVTDIYKGQYSNLEKATIKYILIIPSDSNKETNDK